MQGTIRPRPSADWTVLWLWCGVGQVMSQSSSTSLVVAPPLPSLPVAAHAARLWPPAWRRMLRAYGDARPPASRAAYALAPCASCSFIWSTCTTLWTFSCLRSIVFCSVSRFFCTKSALSV